VKEVPFCPRCSCAVSDQAVSGVVVDEPEASDELVGGSVVAVVDGAPVEGAGDVDVATPFLEELHATITAADTTATTIDLIQPDDGDVLTRGTK
jgi:hypothetical protein